jgi:hypothetical protein
MTMAYGTTNKQAAETKANELRAKYPENKYEVEGYEWPEAFSPFKKRDGEYERDDNGNRIPVNRSVLPFWRTGCGQHSIPMMRWSLDPKSPTPTHGDRAAGQGAGHPQAGLRSG